MKYAPLFVITSIIIPEKKVIKLIINKIVDFFFPKNCYGCQREGSYLCNNCVIKKVQISYTTKCHVCNSEVRIGLLHKECEESTYVDGVVCMMNYEGIIKKMLRDVKYNYHSSVMEDLADLLSLYLKNYRFENLLITSVPLHRSKKWKRGFNQAEILAKKFSKDRYLEILKRSRRTKTQVKLDKSERNVNLKDAFTMNMDAERLQNFFKLAKLSDKKQVLIFDDIYTTGSTLNECAKILKQNGFDKVYGVVLARRGL